MRIGTPEPHLAAIDAIRRRDFRAAIEILEREIGDGGRASAIRGALRESLAMLAQCHEWLGEYESAARYAEHLLSGDPCDARALKLAARCLGQIGDLEHAYDLVCRALAAPEPVPTRVERVLRLVESVPGLRAWIRRRAARRESADREWRRWADAWRRGYERSWRRPAGAIVH